MQLDTPPHDTIRALVAAMQHYLVLIAYLQADRTF